MDDFDNAESLAAQFHDKLSGMGRDGGNATRGSGSGGGRGGGRRGGKRGGRGGGGGGGGGRAVDVSRALSRLLRHQAANAGIPLDPEGYAPLDQVLQWGPLRSMKVTLAEVRDVVITNDKQRFALQRASTEDDGVDGSSSLDLHSISDSDDPAGFRIRANQGHSIAAVASDAGLLTPIDNPETAPPVVCHGTFFAFWPAIEASGGLHRMTRNHVHCGCLEEEEDTTKSVPQQPLIPGLRRDAQLLVYLDVRRALREEPSLKWWRAANGVVLTEGDGNGMVPTRFFKRVVTSWEGARQLPPSSSVHLVLWEDGQKVADVPAETMAKARVPHGKQGLARRMDTAAATAGTKKKGQGRAAASQAVEGASAGADDEA